MKKVLSLILLLISLSIFTQNKLNTFEESPSSVSEGDSIGYTIYDNQSNNSMQRRLHLEEDGTLHAAWTFGVLDPNFTDRGTGYNVRTNGIWGDIPNQRLENQRVGWPDIGVTASGRIYSLTHSSTGLHFAYKNAGSTTWNNSNIPNDTDALWPRSAIDNDQIYTIASRQNSFGGLNGGLAFNRFDGGTAWQGPFSLDFLTDDYGTVTIDCYDIDAAGGTIALVLGGYARQTMVYKSTDGGENWERIPLAVTTAPTIMNSGTAVPEFAPANLSDNISVVVDDNGQIHVAGAWIFNYANQTNTAPSYRPNRAGILYWTEGMDAMELIGNTVAQDWDGNGYNDYDSPEQTSNFTNLDETWRFYSAVAISMPSIAVDEMGNPFIAYTSVVDAHFHNTLLNPVETFFREIFVVKGINDNGEINWQGPYNVSNDENTEDVFPSLPTRIYNNEVNILYMSDSEAGFGQSTNNCLKVVSINPDDISTPEYIAENNPPTLDLLGNTFKTILGCALSPSDIPGLAAWDFPDGNLTNDLTFSPIDFNTLSSNQEVTLSVTDSDGNMVQDTMLFSVIEDTIPPIITLLCPDGTPGCETQVFCDWDTTAYVDPGFTFYDDSECLGLDQSAVNIGGDVVDINTSGTYQITYEAQDFAGNPILITRTVLIIICEPPYISLTVTAPDGSVIQDGGTYVFEADASLTEIPFFIIAEDDVTPIDFTIGYGENGPPQAGVLGDYAITITASNGIDEASIVFVVVVVDTTPPTIALLADTPTEYTFCLGDGTLQDITGDLSVSDNSTVDPILNIVDDINFDELGIYTASYTYTDETGNQSTPIEITYIIDNTVECWGLGIDDITLSNAITISPNPSSEMATVTVDGDYNNLSVSLIDVQGKELLFLENQQDLIQLNLSTVSAGVYYVKVKTDEGTAVKKLIVE